MICRLCITKCNKVSTKIFDEKNENNLAELIVKYLYVDVKQTDALTHICDICKSSLDDFHKFFQSVEERQTMYQKGILSGTEEVGLEANAGNKTDTFMHEEPPSVKEEKDNLMDMSESEFSFGNKDSQSCDIFTDSHNESNNQTHHTHGSTFFIKEQSSSGAFQSHVEDPDLYYLLESWELQHLYGFFYGQKITLKVLKHIQRHHIARLFQELPVGDEVIFEYHLQKWQQNATVPHAIEKPPVRDEKVNPKFSLATLLNVCKHGQQLKEVYESKGCFNEHQRVALINSLARYIDANGISYTLSDCAQIEKEIVATFPSEKLEYYTNGRRGRLYNKLANMKRMVKQITVNEVNQNSSDPPTLHPEQNADHIIALMRSEGISIEQLDNLWRHCAQYRFHSISQAKSIHEVLSTWPEYRQPNGYRLIDYDYQLKYPSASEMMNNWSIKSKKIQNYLKTKLCNGSVAKMVAKIKDLSEELTDSSNLIILWSLHQAFPPASTVVTVTSGVKQRKKFSISDSQESFAIVATTKAEIDAKLKVLQLRGTPVLPCLLILGDLENVKEVFVYFGGVQYKMPSLLKAADICFKAFYVFDLNYPEESTVFYKFIEAYIYNVRPPKMTKIATLINDLENSC